MLQLEHAAILYINDGKFVKEKLKLLAAQKKLSSTILKWQKKFDELHQELDVASDSAYNKKKKRWNAISEQVEKAHAKKNGMKNYIEGINETNLDLVNKVKEAIKLKRAKDQQQIQRNFQQQGLISVILKPMPGKKQRIS